MVLWEGTVLGEVSGPIIILVLLPFHVLHFYLTLTLLFCKQSTPVEYGFCRACLLACLPFRQGRIMAGLALFI